ncbi:MAG: GNAT family protein [Eubacteriales bacterium]|nr:GNAT family protein [Eubacteriales bacterium]
MYIRKAVLADIPAIEKIYADARTFMRAHGNETQWTDGYPSMMTGEDLARGQLYVCEKEAGAGPLAVFVYYIGEDPNYAKIEDGAWLSDAPYGVVHRIAVSERAHGTGAASFCLDWAFSKAGNLRIDTHEDNIPMQRLLEKCGFRRTGMIHVEDGTERVAFQKTGGETKEQERA